jgi:hypothetical protein
MFHLPLSIKGHFLSIFMNVLAQKTPVQVDTWSFYFVLFVEIVCENVDMNFPKMNYQTEVQ